MTNHQDKELSSEQILAIADKWAKEPGFMEFERNDFIGAVRECIQAIASHTAHPNCGACPGDGSICKNVCEVDATSPHLPVAEQPAGQAVPLLDQLKHSLFVRATDEQVNEWAHRHDLFNALNRDPRAAFEDAQTLVSPHSPVAQMSGDLEWHKQALERVSAKLAGVWKCLSDMIEEHTGKPCSSEPFNDLEAIFAASHPSNAVQDAPTRANINEAAAYTAWVRKGGRSDFNSWDAWQSRAELDLSAATVPQVQAPSDEQIIAALEAEGLQCRSSYMTSIGIEQYVTKAAKQTIAAFRALLAAPQPVAAPIVPSDELIKGIANQLDELARDLWNCEGKGTTSLARKAEAIRTLLLTTASNAGEAAPAAIDVRDAGIDWARLRQAFEDKASDNGVSSFNRRAYGNDEEDEYANEHLNVAWSLWRDAIRALQSPPQTGNAGEVQSNQQGAKQ